MNKLKASSMSCAEYVDGAIYDGITTGLNEAFVVDAEMREALIAADPKSAGDHQALAARAESQVDGLLTGLVLMSSVQRGCGVRRFRTSAVRARDLEQLSRS